MADTCKPLGQFPVAEAEDIDFADGESLQKKLDDGSLGGGSGSWVGTREEFENLDKNLLEDGQEVIITDDYDVVNGNVYSEEETVCGKWIDGKPIYRKVIIVEKTGGVNGTTILENVDSLVNIRGEIYFPPENNWFGFPWASSTSIATIIKPESTRKLNIYTSGNFTKLRCTVEYTKNTD